MVSNGDRWFKKGEGIVNNQEFLTIRYEPYNGARQKSRI